MRTTAHSARAAPSAAPPVHRLQCPGHAGVCCSELALDRCLQLLRKADERVDPLRHLGRCAHIHVHRHPEVGLRDVAAVHQLIRAAGGCRIGLVHALQRRLRRGQELEQRRRDRHAVDTRQSHNLVDGVERIVCATRRPPRGGHADGALVTVLLVVLVHAPHAHDAWVGRRLVLRFAAVGCVPILDAPREGRDEAGARLRRRDRLDESKDEGNVARDAFLLELLRRLDALPRPRQLDQHARTRDACSLIHLNDAARTAQRFFLVKRGANVNLGRNIAGHELDDFQAKFHS
mmetsp:Transcript_26656/g.70671  ORF Transcript_26656/g.70671 Transcript_26656/m.70671 type:complete len:290 (-) Transcript_26656:397-1266(-)